jgi:hypothetical protein
VVLEIEVWTLCVTLSVYIAWLQHLLSLENSYKINFKNKFKDIMLLKGLQNVWSIQIKNMREAEGTIQNHFARKGRIC